MLVLRSLALSSPRALELGEDPAGAGQAPLQEPSALGAARV